MSVLSLNYANVFLINDTERDPFLPVLAPKPSHKRILLQMDENLKTEYNYLIVLFCGPPPGDERFMFLAMQRARPCLGCSLTLNESISFSPASMVHGLYSFSTNFIQFLRC